LLELYAKRIRNTVTILFATVICVSLFFFGIDLWSHNNSINIYPLVLASVIFAWGMIDYMYVYSHCKSSAILLHEVDQRLDNVDVWSHDALLANFADYSIATLTAPPIPYKLYLKHHSYLKGLWSQRLSGKNDITHNEGVDLNDLLIDFEKYIIPPWIEENAFLNLLQSAAIEMSKISDKPLPSKMAVNRQPGYSGTPVFEIKLYQGNMLWRQLILRLHKTPEKAKAELDIVRKISNEMVDVVSYCPLEEPFISQGALFYYHANIQTNDQLYYVNEFVENYITTGAVDFDSYFNKMFQGFRSVSKAYNNIRDCKLETFANSFSTINWGMPPAYILDLRQVKYELLDNVLKIPNYGRFPSETDQVLSSPVSVSTEAWTQCTFQVLEIRNYSGTIYEIDISFPSGICRILIDSDRVKDHISALSRKVELLLVPKNCLQTLQEYFLLEFKIVLPQLDPVKNLLELKAKSPREGLHFGFRHTDLHCRNCLVSRSNFKVIDVGDSCEAMICSDIARLEISLISSLVRCRKLEIGEVKEMLELIDGLNLPTASPKAVTVAKIIQQIRTSLISEFKANPTEFDFILSYYIECCRQISYSTSSPMSLSRGIDPLIQYWNSKLTTQLTKYAN